MLEKQKKRETRHRRIRTRIHGTAKRPRLSVFRSNQHVYAQLVNDETGKVMAGVSDLKMTEKKSGVELAKAVGKALAKAAKEQGVSKAVFDRGGYRYHGQVKAVAQGAREGGLRF